MTERNNVLLVVLDSVRAENTSLHGYGRETTPFLSEFADRSTVYTQARAPGIHSIASHVSMFTGAHVEEHRALHHTAQIDPSTTVWHELETEFGYATGLFTNNRIVSDASNLSEAFGYVHEPNYPLTERLEDTVADTLLERAYYEGYDAVSRLTAYTGADSEGDGHTDESEGKRKGTLARMYGALTDQVGRVAGAAGLSGSSGYKTLYGGTFVDAFLEWESRQNGPWAACLNLMDAHSPYEPNPEFDRWATDRNWQIQREEKPSVWETLEGRGWDRMEALEPLYDGTIRQTDEIVRGLVATLDERGLLSETTLVITSDHGEAFGERSRLDQDIRLRDHKWGIHEALTHVPLVVSYPGQTDGAVVDDVVSLTDVPAVLRTAATEGSGTAQLTAGDVALASTFRLPKEQVSKYGSVDDIDSYVGPWRAVYETRDGSVRKFAAKGEWGVTLDIDHAGDATVVSRDDRGRVAEEFDRLADSGLLTRETSDIDDEVEQQLEDLGYMR